MSKFLCSDIEIMMLLRQGIQAEIYAEATPITTKGKIEAETDGIMAGITLELARNLLASKIWHPSLSLVAVIKEKGRLAERG